MFLYREKEMKLLNNKKNTIIYGKRRVGKTTLIKEFLNQTNRNKFYYECFKSSIDANLEYILSDLIKQNILKFDISFKNLYDLFIYINSIYSDIIFVIDEYPYLKELESNTKIDSLLQKIIDECKNIQFIISGSQISMMNDILTEGNPLYARFDNIINLNEFNYIESSNYYSNLSAYDKIAFYSIFGGSPYINEVLDSNLSLKDNIKNLYLNENSRIYNYADNLLISDASIKMNAKEILSFIGNKKTKYSELEDKFDKNKTGKISKQINSLLNIKLIKKVYPINKNNDSKKAYYEINDNVLRFFYTYIYKNKNSLKMISNETFYNEYILPSLKTYISFRFEEQVRSYFSILSKNNILTNILNIGTYYYDDSKNKTSGEFDVALYTKDGYVIYEVKYYKDKLSSNIIKEDVEQIKKIKGLNVIKIGFVNPNGFIDKLDYYDYIDGNDLYNIKI